MPLSRALKICVSILGLAGIFYLLAMPGVFSDSRATARISHNPYRNAYGITSAGSCAGACETSQPGTESSARSLGGHLQKEGL